MKATALYQGEQVIIIDDTLLVRFGQVMIKTDCAKVEWVSFKDLSNVRWILNLSNAV